MDETVVVSKFHQRKEFELLNGAETQNGSVWVKNVVSVSKISTGSASRTLNE